jgi:hypothetical protein
LQRVRLVRKLALSLNGFDLSAISVGQVLSLPEPQAAMLIREGWAEPLPEKHPTSQSVPPEQH